jgi:DNA replication protein DnaC
VSARWAAVRQLDHQQQHAIDPLERPGSYQPPRQRMRLRGNPHLARQHRTKMLQSVAIFVGTGKTHLATALGHIAVRRRLTVHMARADKLFKRLTAVRLDNTLDYEYRRLTTVELLIIDDLALTPLDETATTDFYELTVARHRHNATIVTSNGTPDEWLGLMHDQLLAQSAVDRLTSTCHELVIESDSYRKRQCPSRHSA